MTVDPRTLAGGLFDIVAEVAKAAGTELEVIGIGLATVDLDRAVAQIARRDPAYEFSRGSHDDLVGARAAIARPAEGPALVLLEPSTEGHLAAVLVRHGEGPAVAYVLPRGEPRGVLRSATGAGPLGTGRLVLGRSRFGPHVILLDRPASTMPG